MSNDITKMDFKELRNEVQLLRDELALFKRKYEDAIYNIGADNLSSHLVKEKDDMRAEIKITAEEISTKVSNDDFQSAISQTADKISSIVMEFTDTSKAEEVGSPIEFIDKSKIYVIREYEADGETVKNETFYYYNEVSNSWAELKKNGMLNSLFEQTPDGFKLTGDVRVDGSCILTSSLKFDSSDRPLEVQYSADGVNNWHPDFVSGADNFMQIKIGGQWSDPMRVVGERGSDGAPGTNGTDATVTARTVFDALTSSGATQGIFSAFYKVEGDTAAKDRLFINAEYIRAGTLSGMTLTNSAGTHSMQMSDSTGYGTFRLYNNIYAKNVPYFSIYDNEFGGIGLEVAGNTFLYAAASGPTTEPKGTWDFTDCTVVGLDSTVAVFG